MNRSARVESIHRANFAVLNSDKSCPRFTTSPQNLAKDACFDARWR